MVHCHGACTICRYLSLETRLLLYTDLTTQTKSKRVRGCINANGYFLIFMSGNKLIPANNNEKGASQSDTPLPTPELKLKISAVNWNDAFSLSLWSCQIVIHDTW